MFSLLLERTGIKLKHRNFFKENFPMWTSVASLIYTEQPPLASGDCEEGVSIHAVAQMCECRLTRFTSGEFICHIFQKSRLNSIKTWIFRQNMRDFCHILEMFWIASLKLRKKLTFSFNLYFFVVLWGGYPSSLTRVVRFSLFTVIC